jgi:hypothetical protein
MDIMGTVRSGLFLLIAVDLDERNAALLELLEEDLCYDEYVIGEASYLPAARQEHKPLVQVLFVERDCGHGLLLSFGAERRGRPFPLLRRTAEPSLHFSSYWSVR